MISIREIQKEALSVSQAEFVKAHPEPALVLHPASKGSDRKREDPGLGDTVRLNKENAAAWLEKTHLNVDEELLLDRHRAPLVDLPEVDLEDAYGITHVAFVCKNPEDPSPFPNMVTLGRLPSNDVLVPFTGVSKVHACLLKGQEPGEWFLRDQSSTNGTYVDGKRLGAEEKAAVRDGTWFNLGVSLGVKFFLPATLYGFLRHEPTGDKAAD